MAHRTSGKTAATETTRPFPVYLHALWIILALSVVYVGGRLWNLERHVQETTSGTEAVASGGTGTAPGETGLISSSAALPGDDLPVTADDENTLSGEPAGLTSQAVVAALATPAIGEGINAPALASTGTGRTLSAPPIKERYYWTRPGDSLWSISRHVYGAGRYYTHIAEANGLDDPTLIQANVLLLIPELK